MLHSKKNCWTLRWLGWGWIFGLSVCLPLKAMATTPVVSPTSTNTSPSLLQLLDEAERSPRLEIQLSRRQVVLYRGSTQVKTYPIAVGRQGWETPKGKFEVKQMLKNPSWINPLTGAKIQGGHPDNPLGSYWIGFWTNGRNWIGFHGTPNPESVGTAASHGCIRMYNKDVEELFQQVQVGTPVTVVP